MAHSGQNLIAALSRWTDWRAAAPFCRINHDAKGFCQHFLITIGEDLLCHWEQQIILFPDVISIELGQGLHASMSVPFTVPPLSWYA